MALIAFLHYRNNIARQELHKRLDHLDECIDAVKRDINALRIFMAANYSKQEIQQHWENRDREVNGLIGKLGTHDSQIAVITSELAAANSSLQRVITRLDRNAWGTKGGDHGQ